MKKTDDLILVCRKAKINPRGPDEAVPEERVRTKVIRKKSPWYLFGAMALAIVTTWTLSYDVQTKRLIEATSKTVDIQKSHLDQFQLATTVFLTSTGSYGYTLPVDWNPSNNTVEAIGAGGNSNGGGASTTNGKAGGGGGAYAKISNFPSIAGTNVPVNVAAQPATTAATSGGDTYFKDTSTLLAKGGSGPASATANAGGQGGQASACVGDVKYSGGDGGSCIAPLLARQSGSGGGGAAGPNGPGGKGGDADTGGLSGAARWVAAGGGGGNNGAAGDNGSAGTGNGGAGGSGGGNGGNGGILSGVNPGSVGGAGTNFSGGSHGSGGGGGGGSGNASGNGGRGGEGGLYGGGGGAGGGGSTGGSYARGAQGIIVITYTPSSTGQRYRIFSIGA